MIDFLSQHWLLILQILVLIATLVISIFKKSKFVLLDTAFEQLLKRLPSMIKFAEETGKSGNDKKSIVLGASYALLSDLTGKEVSKVIEEYSQRVSLAIESILETPQKKKEVI